MKQYQSLYSILFILLLVAACGKSTIENAGDVVDSEEYMRVTTKQIKAEGITVGGFETKLFEEFVKCNGYIKAPPNGWAKISSPVSGIVKSINYSVGDYIRKGDVLCVLSSNEFLNIQQNFGEASAMLIKLKADYERSKSLYDQNIGSEKDFKAIESEYKVMSVKYKSLKIWLEQLNLDVTKIENGDLISSYPLHAPISGYIADIDLSMGQFIEPQKNLVEIIDVNKFQLQLSVFESDIVKLRKGDKVLFNTLGESAGLHSAEIIAIGKNIDSETKSIRCLAKIDNEDGLNFVNNSFIESSILVNSFEARAVPDGAILKSDQDHYIFVVSGQDDDGMNLTVTKVSIGRTYNGYTEIIGDLADGKILTGGVYNLQVE